MEISVEQAAAKMGVTPSRIRQLLDRGQLDGRKIGRVWVVKDVSIAQRQRRIGATKTLRRTTPERTWNELRAIADGRGSDVSLLTAYLTADLSSLQAAVSWFRSRAALHLFDCHSRVAERLVDEHWVVVGGARRAARVGAPLDPGSDVDIYIPSSAMDELQRFTRARPSSTGNLCVREVPDAAWFLPTREAAEGIPDPSAAGLLVDSADRNRLADVAAVLDMGESLDGRVVEVAAVQWAELVLTWAENLIDHLAQQAAADRADLEHHRLPAWLPPQTLTRNRRTASTARAMTGDTQDADAISSEFVHTSGTAGRDVGAPAVLINLVPVQHGETGAAPSIERRIDIQHSGEGSDVDFDQGVLFEIAPGSLEPPC